MNGRHANPNEDVELPKQKTNIICTLGPVSRTVDVLERMLRRHARMVQLLARSHEYTRRRWTRSARRATTPVSSARCCWTRKAPRSNRHARERRARRAREGPEARVDHGCEEGKRDDGGGVPSLARDVTPGSKILCADGSITLTVVSCDVKNGTVLVNCENAAKLGERKNVNLPGVCVDLPTITEKDRDDLLNWGVKNKVDFVAASFVRKGKDVEYIRRVLGEAGKTTHVIAKVENMEGLDNYDDIVAGDGVMVARGDLGMEIHLEQIFLAQKRMIKRCSKPANRW